MRAGRTIGGQAGLQHRVRDSAQDARTFLSRNASAAVAGFIIVDVCFLAMRRCRRLEPPGRARRSLHERVRAGCAAARGVGAALWSAEGGGTAEARAHQGPKLQLQKLLPNTTLQQMRVQNGDMLLLQQPSQGQSVLS